ncbi:MAG: BamA/TamA family outer membrane protein [Acidobacteria bacterium]|nr:BamA/TamA family outer membrane protein [Acidobacteriota bacterium]
MDRPISSPQGQKFQVAGHPPTVLTYRQIALAAVLICAVVAASGQTGPTANPGQAPRTAPQTEEVLPSYEGQKVLSVELAGQPNLNTDALLPLIEQRADEPFARSKTDATIKALENKGYQAVELDIRPEADGIRVLFVLQPAVYFGIYNFPEATTKFAYSRLLQITDYPPRGPYTPLDINSSQRHLTRFFQQSGFFEVEVKPEIEVDKAHGIVNVVFHTNFGRHAKFGTIDISGATPEETAHLEHALRSWIGRLRSSALIKGKPYSLKRVQNATAYLNTVLMKQGFLGAQVKLVGAEYDPDTNRANIHFNVNTGPKVDAQVTGVHLWSWTKRNLLPVYQQAGINPEIIQEGRQNLLSYVQKKGFFDAQVTADVNQQPNKEMIVYRVNRGARHKVTNVEVAGNRRFSSRDLLSRVTVEKKSRWWLLSHGHYSQQLVRESVNNLKKIYAAEGYSSATVTPQVVNHGGDIGVVFRVEEGPQDTVATLRLEGNTTQSIAQLAPHGLKVEDGQAYSQKRVDDDRGIILAHYLTSGYLNASFRATVAPVDKQHPHQLVVVYHILEGPQVRIAQVNTIGRKHTRPEVINRTVAMRTEQALREDQMLISEDELYNLGIFDWSEIDPRRAITTQTQEDVLVKVHEAKRNIMTYGYGFEVINRGGSVPGGTVALPGIPPVGVSQNFRTSEKTFYGPRGSIEYTRRNVRGRAESLTLSGLAGRLDQRALTTYEDPHFRQTNWSSQFSLQGEHNSQNPIFTSRLGQIGWQLQHPLNPDKTNNVFLRYDFSETGITRLLIPGLIPSQDLHVRLSTWAANFIRDTRDNVLDAHKGIYESYEFDFNPHALGSSVDFVKLLTQAAYYKKIPADIIWANSLRIGIEEPFAGSHVPLSQEFFSGGGSTLRGFPLNGAGPQRKLVACGTPGVASTCSLITVPQGGKQLLILNTEFRVPVPLKQGLSMVGFYDGGNVFLHVGFHGQYTNTVGIGIRYATPIGPVRFDIGHNLNAPPGIKSTQYFVTIGQAF